MPGFLPPRPFAPPPSCRALLLLTGVVLTFFAPFSCPCEQAGPQRRGRSPRWVVAATAAAAAGAIGLVASLQHLRATSLVSEVDALQDR